MEKILVIDDELVIRSLLRQLFEQAGYEVAEACDGKEGIKCFKTQHPDLVITDLIMPDTEGIETIRHLKQIKPDVKIVAISGGGVGNAQVYLSLARKMGAQHVFEKPFDAGKVLTTVQNMLAQT